MPVAHGHAAAEAYDDAPAVAEAARGGGEDDDAAALAEAPMEATVVVDLAAEATTNMEGASGFLAAVGPVLDESKALDNMNKVGVSCGGDSSVGFGGGVLLRLHPVRARARARGRGRGRANPSP